jgi:hypothetical protein
MSEAESTACAAIRDELALAGLDVLDADGRDRVAAHLEHCPACRAELAGYTVAADALLDAVPPTPAPAGFTEATLDRLRREPRPVDSGAPGRVVRVGLGRRRLAVAAVLVVVLGAGVGLGSLLGGASGPAPSAAGSGAARRATLVSASGASGSVVLTPGADGWLVMTVEGGPPSTAVRCEIGLPGGDRRVLGTFALAGGWGSWAVRLPVPAANVRMVEVVAPSGSVVASAELPR